MDSASVAGSPESVSVVGAAVLVADVFQDLITTAVHTFEMAAAGLTLLILFWKIFAMAEALGNLGEKEKVVMRAEKEEEEEEMEEMEAEEKEEMEEEESKLRREKEQELTGRGDGHSFY